MKNGEGILAVYHTQRTLNLVKISEQFCKNTTLMLNGFPITAASVWRVSLYGLKLKLKTKNDW